MGRTHYARTFASNFNRRQLIEQLFDDILKQSSQDAAITLIKLQGKLRQPKVGRAG